MISCEDFERYLLQLHHGRLTGELKSALDEHRRICHCCEDVTPELIKIRQRLMLLVRLEPRPGFEMRLSRKLEYLSEPLVSRDRSWEKSWVTNWLAFGVGAAATVMIGFLIFSHQPAGISTGSPMTAENKQAMSAGGTESPEIQQQIDPDLLTRNRENLPFGSLDDSTGEFRLTADRDTVPVNQIPPEWRGQVVSQPK